MATDAAGGMLDDRPTKAIIDQYMQSFYSSDKKTKKKKKKDEQIDMIALDSLKRGRGIRKDNDDVTISANLYDPDDVKSRKSNKRTEEEQALKCNDRFMEEHNTGQKKKAVKKVKLQMLVTDDDGREMDESVRTPTKKVSGRKGRLKSVETAESPPSMEEEAAGSSPRQRDVAVSKSVQRLHTKKVTGRDQDEQTSTTDLAKEKKAKKKKPKRKETVVTSAIEENEEGEMEARRDEEEEEETGMPSADDQPPDITDDGFIVGLIIHRTDKLKSDFFMSQPVVRVHIIDVKTGASLKKQHRDRAVTSFYESEDVDFILPMMTQPFDFKQKMSVLPVWEDMLQFNENFNYFIQDDPEVMIFFELLDLMTMNRARRQYQRVKEDSGWHRIAWAFLKVVGSNGEPNTGKKLRLQLYDPVLNSQAPKSGSLPVYEWWKKRCLRPYPSTLYVTLKATRRLTKVQPATRSMFATQQEQGQLDFDMMQLTTEQSGVKREEGERRRPAVWSRLTGQVCKVPNKLTLSLPAGGRGCFVVEFSHNGRFLACGCHEKDGYPIIIYEVPSGRLHGHLLGHYSIIYDLCWSRDDKTLVSASADGTARVWNVLTMSCTPVKTAPHPSFIYAAKFHVRVQRVLVTGGYDGLIRVWSLHGEQPHAELVQELEGHQSFVNSICFDSEGTRMYSADNSGCVISWNVHVTDRPSKKGILQDWTMNEKIQDKEVEGVAISCVKTHPVSHRLLVQTKDNTIRHFDLRVSCVMQRFVGALNFRERIRCDYSPCGSFVFSGSEDRCVYVWNAETGDQVAAYTELGFQTTVCDVAYHPYDHMVAFCAFGDSHPVLVYKYDRQVAEEDAGLGIAYEALTVKLTGRPGSPEVKAGTYQLDADTDSKTRLLDSREEFSVNETARYQRIMRKLNTVSAFTLGSGVHAPSSEHSMLSTRGESVRYPTGEQTMLSWGSTFDSTAMLALPDRSLTPDAGLMSPTQYRSTAARHQQFAAQTQYMQQSGSGWRPTFQHVGGQSVGKKSAAQICCMMEDGKPEFTFQTAHAPTTGSHMMVVALYDYAAQRSDELSLQCGDTIKVLHKDTANWWMGELASGKQGFFPANYVTGADDVEEQCKSEDDVDVCKEEDKRTRRTTAVVTQSGKLSFISGAEDSDMNEMQTPTRKKKTVRSGSKTSKDQTRAMSPKDQTRARSPKAQTATKSPKAQTATKSPKAQTRAMSPKAQTPSRSSKVQTPTGSPKAQRSPKARRCLEAALTIEKEHDNSSDRKPVRKRESRSADRRKE